MVNAPSCCAIPRSISPRLYCYNVSIRCAGSFELLMHILLNKCNPLLIEHSICGPFMIIFKYLIFVNEQSNKIIKMLHFLICDLLFYDMLSRKIIRFHDCMITAVFLNFLISIAEELRLMGHLISLINVEFIKGTWYGLPC